MVSFRVGCMMCEIGTASFLHSFFSTVAYRLENNRWGSKFPVIMNELYQGKLSFENVPAAKEELTQIKKALTKLSPNKVIWDIEDLSRQPPWGKDISSDISDLSDYFVTSDGRNLIKLTFAALEDAKSEEENLKLESL